VQPQQMGVGCCTNVSPHVALAQSNILYPDMLFILITNSLRPAASTTLGGHFGLQLHT